MPERAVGALAAQVCARLFRQGPGTPVDLWSQHLLCLRARDRWRDRVRYSVRFPVTPNPYDLEWLRLPGALHPRYYVVRPIRLAVKYGARLIRGAWGCLRNLPQ